MKEMHKD